MIGMFCVLFAVTVLSSSLAEPALENTNQPAPGRKPRARDLGVPFEGTPGPQNAITDVRGVEVGHTTLIAGEGKLELGKGPVRTGVTAILPRGKASSEPVFAGIFALNGNGEMTGSHWVEESGYLEGPLMLTNTHSVGVVRDAVIAYQVKQGSVGPTSNLWSLPLVAETWDGFLNDINGFHVKPIHVFAAWESARAGPAAEGSVGGGTGMICYGWKGGVGTSSRQLVQRGRTYTLGALVQANHGLRNQLLVAGVPVGRELSGAAIPKQEAGSIIIVVATDAPLLPHQLKRIARRASLGLARTGSTSGNGSGDLFIAFSTARAERASNEPYVKVEILSNDDISAYFDATVQATEEAIINTLVAAETMTGINGHRIEGLPHAQLKDVLKRYNRLSAP
jgi:D-aminopeptidase